MVSSRQEELPFYRGICGQRGRCFGALARVFGRTAVPSLRKFIVQAAKRMGGEVICCARSCRCCWWWKKFQDSCKESGKANSEKTIG